VAAITWPELAVTALSDLILDPRGQRTRLPTSSDSMASMVVISRPNPHRRPAVTQGAHHVAVHQHGARTALRQGRRPYLVPVMPRFVADDPEQRRVGFLRRLGGSAG